MIELGNKKGTKDESHFILRVNMSTGDKAVAGSLDFDVYAETAEEVQEILNGYFDELFSMYGFKRRNK